MLMCDKERTQPWRQGQWSTNAFPGITFQIIGDKYTARRISKCLASSVLCSFKAPTLKEPLLEISSEWKVLLEWVLGADLTSTAKPHRDHVTVDVQRWLKHRFLNRSIPVLLCAGQCPYTVLEQAGGCSNLPQTAKAQVVWEHKAKHWEILAILSIMQQLGGCVQEP